MVINNTHQYFTTFILLIVCVIASCSKVYDEDVKYIEDTKSPMKEFACKYTMTPILDLTDNSIVSIELKDTINKYNFIKFFSDGSIVSKPFNYNFNIEIKKDENSDISNEDVENTIKNSISGQYIVTNFGKNAKNEYYFHNLNNSFNTYYISNTIAVSKFDKDGNILMSIADLMVDYTLSENSFLVGTPLDDGGYAVVTCTFDSNKYLFYNPYQDFKDNSNDFNYYIRLYNDKGKFVSENQLQLPFKDITIDYLCAIDDRIFIFFSDYQKQYLYIFSYDGTLINSFNDIDIKPNNSMVYNEQLVVSATNFNGDKSTIVIFNKNGEVITQYWSQQENALSAFYNLTPSSNGKFYLAGYKLDSFTGIITLNPSPFDSRTDVDGLIVEYDGNTFKEYCIEPVYGIVVYALVENNTDDFTLFFENSRYGFWRQHILTLNIDNLSQINLKQEIKQPETDNNNNQDNYYYGR